jgi:hypothetical protein
MGKIVRPRYVHRFLVLSRELLMKLKQGLEDVIEAEELDCIGGTEHMVSSNISISAMAPMIIKISKTLEDKAISGNTFEDDGKTNILFVVIRLTLN